MELDRNYFDYTTGDPLWESPHWLSLSFGAALRKIRYSEQMTMQELSKKSRVSQSYISQLEHEVRLPSEKVINDLAKALAKGKDVQIDPFDPSSLVDTYYEPFMLEAREQQITDLLTRIKSANEKKQLQKTYWDNLSNNSNQTKVALKKEEIDLLKIFNKLDENSKRFVVKFIHFILNK